MEDVKSGKNVSDEPVDEDWANRYFNYAKDMSSEEMQTLWARILTGETMQPGKFSIRTLEVVRNISKREAECFNRLSKSVLSIGNMAFVSKPQQGNLKEMIDLNYEEMMICAEAGLILSNELQFKLDDPSTEVAIIVGNKILFVVSSPEKKEKVNLRTGMFRLTEVGRQLVELIPKTEPNMSYVTDFALQLSKQGAIVSIGNILRIQEGNIHWKGKNQIAPVIEPPFLQ